MFRRLLSLTLMGALSGALLAAGLPAANAQVPSEFDAGDIYFRTHVYFEMSSTTSPGVDLIPGEGLSGKTFRERPSGEPGWGRMLKDQGWNVFQLDHVGCGNTLPPPNDDPLMIIDKGLYGVYQLGIASQPRLAVAHGFATALVIKAKSWDERASASAVLIDPWGPQFVNPMLDLDAADLVENEAERADRVWREFGFGKRYGELRKGLDLTMEEAKTLVDGYEHDQPPYWAGLLTGLDSGFDLREPIKLLDWPVLLVRTPAADATQIEREKAVRSWLEEVGCKVDFVDLSKEGFGDVSALPWAGARSGEVLDFIMTWWEGLGLPRDNTTSTGR